MPEVAMRPAMPSTLHQLAVSRYASGETSACLVWQRRA